MVLYVTGEGQTLPAGVTGRVTVASPTPPRTPQPLLPVTAFVAGQGAVISFYGEAPGIVSGVMQINVQLPPNVGPGDLPDGTRNGPGISARGGNPGAYFGPGAGPGPFHHYVFEFYALDTKLDLPAATTREDLLKAMEGHVIGKAAYTGRFRTPQ